MPVRAVDGRRRRRTGASWKATNEAVPRVRRRNPRLRDITGRGGPGVLTATRLPVPWGEGRVPGFVGAGAWPPPRPRSVGGPSPLPCREGAFGMRRVARTLAFVALVLALGGLTPVAARDATPV